MAETAEQYRQRMFVLVNGRDAVKLQAAAPARLAKLLKGVSPAKARKRPAPRKNGRSQKSSCTWRILRSFSAT
jgi:hypothetical protein